MNKAELQEQLAGYIAERFDRMFEPGEVHELRVPKVDGKNNRIDIGFFDDYQALAKAAASYSGRAPGVYITMDQLPRDLLARGNNKVVQWAGESQGASNDNVTRRTWFKIDADPVRLTGISATDEEMNRAILMAQSIREWLTDREWPKPLFAPSGNGAHLPYRIDLENTPKNTELIEKATKALGFWFDDKFVKIDQTITNAARIWKVYGTKACKGDDIPDFRPHRYAKVELDDIPDFDQIVTREQLQALADLLPEDENDDETKNQKSYTGGDAFQWLNNWMGKNHLDVSQERPFDGNGRKWKFNVCPHNADHTDGAALLQFASGKIGFKCHHNGCNGKGWQDLKAIYDGPKETRPKSKSGTAASAADYDGQDLPNIGDLLGGGSFTPSQIMLAELKALGYTFQQNELDDVIHVGGERLDNGLAAKIKTQIRDIFTERIQADEKPDWRPNHVEDTYTAAAYDNRFHPVRDYLNGLKWDGERFYIAELAKHFTSTDPAIVYPKQGDRGKMVYDTFGVWLRKWGIGTVAKVLNPSSQTQVPMLVIVGKQGDGKSTFAQWLGSPLSELTIESAIQPDNPEHLRYLSTKWIWEVAELGATTRRSDVEALKSFITRIDATYRKPYDKHPITKPALSSFIGTVNDGIGFLNDISGNRRFLVARIGAIDWDYIDNIDINQFWAEAVHAYRAGESWHLDTIQTAHRDVLNSQHETEDALEGWILKYFEINTDFTIPDGTKIEDLTEDQTKWLTESSEIVSTLQIYGVTGGTKAIQNGVASYLKKQGLQQHWSRPRKWIGVKPQEWLLRLREKPKL